MADVLGKVGTGPEATDIVPVAIVDFTGAPVDLSGGGGGGTSDATAAKQDLQITQETASAAVLGTTTGAAIVTDADGTIQRYLRGLVKRWADALGAGTAAAALRVTLATDGTVIGPTNEAAAADPTAVSGLNGLIRGWWTSLLVFMAQFPAVLGAGGGLKTNIYDPDGLAVGFHGWQSNYLLLSSAASNNLINIKASAGHLAGISGVGVRASKMYIRLFNKVTVAMGTDAPKYIYEVPATAGRFDIPIPDGGLYFDIGISMAITAAAASLDNTIIAVGDVLNLNAPFD